jgi:hypothetical protein
MRVPLEGAGGVEHGESTDVTAEPARIGAEGRERIEGGAEEDAEERALVLAHRAAELRREGEDDVEVGYGQQQVALALEPAGSRTLAATRASAVVAGMKEHVLPSAHGALGEVATERSGATA